MHKDRAAIRPVKFEVPNRRTTVASTQVLANFPGHRGPVMVVGPRRPSPGPTTLQLYIRPHHAQIPKASCSTVAESCSNILHSHRFSLKVFVQNHGFSSCPCEIHTQCALPCPSNPDDHMF